MRPELGGVGVVQDITRMEEQTPPRPAPGA
jgi:hypothetical protein